MNKLEQMFEAKANGIKIPYSAMRAADEAGIPFAVMCAVLQQESSGGKNVFGQDPTIFIRAGKVTKKKYLAYKKERDAQLPHRKMQGVGPMQLTWWEYQDEADRLGGCWKGYINCLVGARILKKHYDATGSWKKAFTKYNGSSSYGETVFQRMLVWNDILEVD